MASKYIMSISLNVLNHLGVNLYSNIPAVLAEVIANAWDADATEVQVEFDRKNKAIIISDNGHGMNLDDINEKYLHVGYRKRDDLKPTNGLTPEGRRPMGRKGIGKLSLFSIANKIRVYSKKQGERTESFLMDTTAIKKAIQEGNPSSSQDYEPEPIPFDVDIPTHGTVIKIEDLKKFRLTQAAGTGLRKRIARRFGIIKENGDFKIWIDGDEVTFSDRDYFHKARFIFQYGDYDYAQHCINLDTDDKTGKLLSSSRPSRFTREGRAASNGKYKISGWIAIARHAHDLDSGEDNLNKITIVIRGKVAQEDILQEYRLGGLITKYMYGEINADFLDEDEQEDITTSSRQKILEEDTRYSALKIFIESELRYIWNRTNILKGKQGLQIALANPHIADWFHSLKPKALQKTAEKIFSDIEKAEIDEKRKPELYSTYIAAFEAQKMKHALDELKKIDETNLETFLSYLSDLDDLEATRYHEIVQGRLAIIRKLIKDVNANVIERAIQKYIYKHLWLLDPAWERATEYANIEEPIQAAIDNIEKPSRKDKAKHYRIDIRYQRVRNAHVIVELKRPEIVLNKTQIEQQVRRYISAVKKKLREINDSYPVVETVCIVGKQPVEWSNPEVKEEDERSLGVYSIRVITYSELIKNAQSAYLKFTQVSESVGKIRKLIKKIQDYESNRAHKNRQLASVRGGKQKPPQR